MEIYPIAISVVILLSSVVVFLRRPRPAKHTEDIENIRKERDSLHIKLARMEQQIEHDDRARDRIETIFREDRERWHTEMGNLRNAYLEAEKSVEKANAFYQSQQEKINEQKQEIQDIRHRFNLEFEGLANKILEEKTQKFTEANSKSIDNILNPLKEKIKNFEEKVDNVYQMEAAERNSLKGVVQQLMEQSLRIKDEANNLTRALKGDNKRQGNWGEVILERVLERSGLIKDQEYRLQASMIDEDGRRLQPDAIINLPDEKHLVVDSKVSLVAYEQWVNTEDGAERDTFAKQHILSIENHIKGLSAKNYQDLYLINSPDFVLLFMPIESAFSMSISHKPDLFSDAWDRRVVIVSPSTLLATLRTIASIWKQERQTQNVMEIAKEAGALYDKFVGFMQDMDKVSEQLNRALQSHENATRKLGTGPGNVIRKVEKLKKLGARASKQIDSFLLDDDEA